MVKVPGNGRLKKDLLIIKEGGSTFCSLAEQNFTFGVRPIGIYIRLDYYFINFGIHSVIHYT